MKILLAVLMLLPISLLSQVVDSIAEDYSMVSVTGGTTLVDASGNGNNGTIGAGFTTSANGQVFPGTAVITIPSVVGNNNFCAELLVSNGNAGILWYEGDSSQSVGVHIGSQLGGTSVVGNAGATGASWSGFSSPRYYTFFNFFYLCRDRATGIAGVLDQNLYESRNLGNITALTTTCGAIGGQAFSSGCSSYNSFLPSGAVIAWTRIRLNPQPGDLQADYAAIRSNVLSRGIYLPDLIAPMYPASVWQRKGVVLESSNGLANEKVLALTTGCQLVSSPCLAMVLDNGTALGYTESTDGVHWHSLTTVTLSGTRGGAGYEPGWAYDSSTGLYWLSIRNNSDAIDIYVSPPNTPNSYTLSTGSVVSSTSAGFTSNSINNSGMLKVGGTMYLVFDGQVSGCGGACGYIRAMTTSDYVTWTLTPVTSLIGSGNPEAMGGPTLYYANNEWYLRGHSTGGAPNLLRYQSSTFNAIFQRSSPSGFPLSGAAIPVLSGTAPDELGQMASASAVSPPWAPNQTYMYYCASDASNILKIKLVVANMPMAQVLLTGEGASADVP